MTKLNKNILLMNKLKGTPFGQNFTLELILHKYLTNEHLHASLNHKTQRGKKKKRERLRKLQYSASDGLETFASCTQQSAQRRISIIYLHHLSKNQQREKKITKKNRVSEVSLSY